MEHDDHQSPNRATAQRINQVSSYSEYSFYKFDEEAIMLTYEVSLVWTWLGRRTFTTLLSQKNTKWYVSGLAIRFRTGTSVWKLSAMISFFGPGSNSDKLKLRSSALRDDARDRVEWTGWAVQFFRCLRCPCLLEPPGMQILILRFSLDLFLHWFASFSLFSGFNGTQPLLSWAFSTLFPRGEAEFTLPHQQNITFPVHVHQRLMKFHDGCFACHPRFHYVAFNTMMRHQSNTRAGFDVRCGKHNLCPGSG